MISTYLNADKTLHWKISGNINDTDTFPHIFSLKNVIFRNEFMHEFMREFAHVFVDEFFANFVHELARIRMNFWHEKLVMLRMACTVGGHCYPVLHF